MLLCYFFHAKKVFSSAIFHGEIDGRAKKIICLLRNGEKKTRRDGSLSPPRGQAIFNLHCKMLWMYHIFSLYEASMTSSLFQNLVRVVILSLTFCP